MKTGRKMLIATILVAMILLNCILPVVKVGANTDVRVTFESNLYSALKDELSRQGIEAVYIDEQRTIIIGDEEIAKVTTLSLANSELTDLTGLDTFSSLSMLDLSSNELTKDSNLEVLSSLNLSSLDLSSNAIEDVSMITNLDNIPNVILHNQKFDIVHIIELDTTNTSDQITQVQYALPQILSKAGYLKTEWLIEETSGEPYINWSRFDHKNLKVEVAYKNGSTYEPYKSMVTLRINISDSTNILYNSDINMFFIVVDSDERGIHIPDENMYNAIKEQLSRGQNINSELISYFTTPKASMRNIYERVYDEPQVLVITIDDIINKIPSLILSNQKIEKIDGIEYFVGLETELDLSGNYIKSIDKLIELQENQEKEEAALRERVSKQLSLVSDTLSKISSITSSIESETEAQKALKEEKEKLEKEIVKLQDELAKLKEEKVNLEEEKEKLSTEEIPGLQADIEALTKDIEVANAELAELNKELVDINSEKEALEKELATLKEELVKLETNLDNVEENAKENIENAKAKIAAKEEEISLKNEEIAQKQTDIESKQAEIDSINEQIAQKQEEIDTKTTTIAIYDTRISEINIEIVEKEQEITATMEQLESNAYVGYLLLTQAEQEEKADELINQIAEHAATCEDCTNADIVDHLPEIMAELNTIYAPINQKIEVIAGKVISLETTEEEISAEFAELYEIIRECVLLINSGSQYWASKGENADCAVSFEAIALSFAELANEMEYNYVAEDGLKYLETIEATALDLNREYKLKMAEGTAHLTEEKLRLQEEILALQAEIDAIDTSVLEMEKALLEEEKTVLKEEKTNLEAEKAILEDELSLLKENLEAAEETLINIEDTEEYKAAENEVLRKQLEIKEKENEIAEKQIEINEAEKAIIDLQTEIDAKVKELETLQNTLTEKQNALTEKENALTQKDSEIAAKIQEIAQVVENLNKQNESIAQSELKLIELRKNKELLDEILSNQIAKLYKIYNRVDKLTSFAISELKTMTTEEMNELTFEEAKALFEQQVEKIISIEEHLTSYEKAYLISKYNVPLEIRTIKEEVIANEDGTTTTVEKEEVKEIEDPISGYFEDLKDRTEEWTLSEYLEYLESFRTDDVYLSMIAYCYLVRLNDGLTTCQAEKYVDIEIQELELDGYSTDYLADVKNNFDSVLNMMRYSCEGVPSKEYLYIYASRMVNSTGDINTYVCLPRLKSLNIRENLIENIDKVTELTELRVLNAYDNEIVDISTVDWASMNKLRVMNLGYNGISDIKLLEVLPVIETLYVDENLIAGSLDFDISKLEKLKYLDLSENQIDDIEELIKYLTFEARANGYDSVMDYLNDDDTFKINIQEQSLFMNVDRKLEINENRKIELPKIFRQIEEIDSKNTSFGINSLYGNITNDGKQVILNTSREGNFNASVSIIQTDYTYNSTSIANGTTCTINYTVGEIVPVSVKVSSETNEVLVGETLSFNAEVTGEEVSYKGVTWEIDGATSENTTISAGGILTVGADETADTITVRARSIYDATKTAEVQVAIIKKSVTGVTITPETATIFKGESLEFTAEVLGENLEEADKGIEWDVLVEETDPVLAEGTTASFSGNKLTLSIGEEETISKFIVVAKSTFDEEKLAEAVVTISERTVSELTVTPNTASVEKGKTQEFKVTVNGENLREEDKAVTYLVTGNTSEDTTISNEGVLTIASDEKASTITVKVVSNYDETKTAEVTVVVVTPKPSVELGYTVEEEYIVDVATKTPVDAFKEILTDEYTVVVKLDEKEVKTGYMKTGMYVEVRDENGDIVIDEEGNLLVYEVVVKGDVNGDGVADAIDSSLIKAIRNEVGTVTDAQMRAADIDNNGKVDLSDSKLLLYHRAEVQDYCLDYAE